jgi:hypothetical protein
MEINVAQNIYDNPDFFAGYSHLPRQVHGLDGAPEWPAVRAMLPPLTGKRVADLGCGFGGAARWMRAGRGLGAWPRSVAEHDRTRQGRYLGPGH